MEDVKAAEERIKAVSRKHPFGDAGILSKIFFTWSLPLFYDGVKRNLNEEDLFPPLKSHESKSLGDKLEAAWMYELKTNKNPSLWRALWNVFKYNFLSLGLVHALIEMVIRLSQPLSLSRLLQYYQPNSLMTKSEAYMYASFIVAAAFFNSLFIHNYMVHRFHLGMKIRVACCTLVYRKALKLSNSSLAQTTIGQMVNLLANDVNRFNDAAGHLNNLWTSPLLLIIIMYLLPIYVGYTATIGIGFLLLFIPVQMWMGKKTSRYRLRTAIRTDERIRLMNEIITGIQVIKMYTWEKPFTKLVEITRRKEIQQIIKNSTIRAITLSFNLILNRVAIYLCVITYVLLGNTPTSQYVFVTISFYGLLRQAVTTSFPRAITSLAEMNISVGRLRKFLMYEEVGDINLQISSDSKKSVNDILNNEDNKNVNVKTGGLSIENVCTKWVQSSSDYSLENISLAVAGNETVAIVGPVGSGKSTLLHLILKELPPTTGLLRVNGEISYASQEPWLFTGSIKQNILFGQEFIPYKYQEVVRACALGRDFALLPFGDRTRIGERGVTLSGGQKARISLARAIYKDADIYLLDDPLSAVDTNVGKQLFDKCISGYLKNKCVILVTHQLQYLQNVEKIVLLQNGKIEACGNYRELKASGKEFTKLLASLEEEKEEVVNKRRTSRKSSDSPDEDKIQPQPEQEKETRSTGTVSMEVYKTYIRLGGHWLRAFLLFVAFIFSQSFGSCTDYFITFWVNLEERKNHNKFFDQNNTSSTSSAETDSSFNNYPYLTENNCLIIYSSLVVLVACFSISRSIVFFRYCIRISTTLHNSLFKNIVHAPLRFFTTNPSGRILNRFSKDMGYIDESLPMTIMDTIQVGLNVVAITLVVGSINPWVLIPAGVMLIVFYILRTIFLASSRDIKRLEGTTRSPIFSHLTASLQGLSTIRAFGAQEVLKNEFDNYQNTHSGAFFMFLGANRTFGFWLDIQCVAYIAFVTLGFLFIGEETYGGNVGLAITQSLTLTGMFQWGMRQWSEMENQMTSVERVKEYIDLKREDNTIRKEPPDSWPEKGRIKVDNISLRYAINEPYVLKNVSFDISSGEKIGIVGRTGAGKSSLVVALFRLAELEGRILIDDIDTMEIGLKGLRSKISIIPQEPVLFSGTLRKNLDPFDEYNDTILWKALNEVELMTAASDLPQGLETKISEGGSNFSVGQRQLICLARAIIRNNKILVLDEATANIDPQTDALIQSTIREKFSSCTVLTIAHRLHTIMDSDKVLLMDAGRVVQFDHPHVLLKNDKGLFYRLVEQTGKNMAKNLSTIAEQNYEEKLNP